MANLPTIKVIQREIVRAGFSLLPPIVVASGDSAARRFIEFFLVSIRNKNTRIAYSQAIIQFLTWCEERQIQSLRAIQPLHVAAYIEKHTQSIPTVKQHLAAIRKLFDWMVIGQVIPNSPAASVRGPKYIVKRGKTPVLSAEQCRALLDSIGTESVIDLRDRALIGIMVYSFARVSAAILIKVEDYFRERGSWKFRLHEKGGSVHVVPAHPAVQDDIKVYFSAADLKNDASALIFRTVDRSGRLTERGMSRTDVLKMIKRRSKRAGLPFSTCCHTFRGSGITIFRENGGTLERAQSVANHSSPRTTKLYDRTDDEVTADEIERIVI